MTPRLRINKVRLLERLDEMARIGALEAGGVSRLSLTDPDKQARDQLVRWMEALNLTVQIDRVGNIFGIRPGQTGSLPVMFGSHIDTVSVAGKLDGTYGVLAALECIATLNEHNKQTLRPLVVAAFTNEEGVRYASGMLGSAVYVGELPIEQALDMRGVDGSRFGDELQRIGYAGPMQPGAIEPYAYLELHIEQGPVLDRAGQTIGVVEGVTGITWLEIIVIGAANHAGTTPMDMRRDAGLAAAKVITYLREITAALGEPQRATCGRLSFEPNAINVIPGRVAFTVDLRNPEPSDLRRAEAMLREYLQKVVAEEGVKIEVRDLEHVQPVRFDPLVIGAVERAARRLGLSYRPMISGAGHDAQLMAHKYPAAMIFVPSRDGISHNPAEYTDPNDLAHGANVLLHAVLDLATRH